MPNHPQPSHSNSQESASLSEWQRDGDGGNDDYIGFWKRFLASIIDTIFLSAIIFPPLLWIYGWEYFDFDIGGRIQNPKIAAGWADLFLSWILPVVLVLGFWILKRATPGKLIFSAEILDARGRCKPTLTQWIVRYLGYFVSLIPFGLGFLWVAFDSRKQGWHDKLAGTVVVRRPDGAVPPPLPK